MDGKEITVTMQELKELLKTQEGEFILHVEVGGGESNATEKPVQT